MLTHRATFLLFLVYGSPTEDDLPGGKSGATFGRIPELTSPPPNLILSLLNIEIIPVYTLDSQLRITSSVETIISINLVMMMT
jgi:hypothetical protein